MSQEGRVTSTVIRLSQHAISPWPMPPKRNVQFGCCWQYDVSVWRPGIRTVCHTGSRIWDKTSHLSALVDNTAKYNDAVPIVYGTGWLKSPVIFSRNDGNLTHMETLVGLGPISSILKVVVADIEIPLPTPGQDMSATGWYSVVSLGSRQGSFNSDFVDSSEILSAIPREHRIVIDCRANRISTGQSSPNVQVLVQGVVVDTFGTDGSLQGTAFSNNPAG